MSQAPLLVTGAAGFVGSHLVRRLREDGHRVVGVDAFRATTTQAAATIRLAALAGDPGFDLVRADLTAPSFAQLVAVLRPRTIFHLAARPGVRDDDIPAQQRDNVRATAAVVDAAQAAGVGRLVFTSSSSVYGAGGGARASGESDAVAPISPYASAKRAAELLCLAARTPTSIVRLFTVYGPGQRADMAFARFIAAALDGTSAPLHSRGRVARDFTYVADAVEGIVLAWVRGTAPIYNISGGVVVELETACQVIEELTGAPLRTHAVEGPAEPASTRADLSLAESQLGYRPRTGWQEGLALQVTAARDARARPAGVAPAA